MHLSVRLERLIAVSAIPGYIQHETIFSSQFYAMPPAIGCRGRAEIENHIEHRAPCTAYELRFKGWRFLKVHSAHRAFSQTEPHVRLHGNKLNPMLFEFAGAPRPHKPAPIILMGNGFNDPGAVDEGLNEMHPGAYMFIVQTQLYHLREHQEYVNQFVCFIFKIVTLILKLRWL